MQCGHAAWVRQLAGDLCQLQLTEFGGVLLAESVPVNPIVAVAPGASVPS